MNYSLRRLAPTLTVAVLLGSSLGCSAPRTDLFAEFAQATADLRDNSDTVLAAQAEWAQERWVEAVSTTPEDSLRGELVSGLLLEPVEREPYAWALPEGAPLFLSARAFRRDVFELNDGVARYAELLRDLSGEAAITEEEFRDRVESVHADLDHASRAMGDTLSRPSLAIFAVGASELFEEYLQSQRRKELAEALRENQGTVEETAQLLRRALTLAAEHARQEYQVRSYELAARFTPEAGLSPNELRRLAEELIGLTNLFITRLEALKTLDDSCARLPGANQNLVTSLSEKTPRRASIQHLIDNARRLHRLYEDLVAEGQSENPKEVRGNDEPGG